MQFVAGGVLVVALAAGCLRGQTAILECVSAGEHGARTRLLFRLPLGAKPRVERATLVAHVREGEAEEVKINGKRAELKRQERGWVTVAVPAGEALKPLMLEGMRVDGCTPPAFAPYVVLEGPGSK